MIELFVSKLSLDKIDDWAFFVVIYKKLWEGLALRGSNKKNFAYVYQKVGEALRMVEVRTTSPFLFLYMYVLVKGAWDTIVKDL